MILKCEICGFDFNSTVHTPLALPCGHTYCIVCIEKSYKRNWEFNCFNCKQKYYNIKFPINEYVKIMRRKKLSIENIVDVSFNYNFNLKIRNEINFCFFNGNYYIEKKNNDIINNNKGNKRKNNFYELNPVKGIKSIKIEKNIKFKKEDSTRTKTISSNNSKCSSLSNYYPSKNKEYSSLFNYCEFMKKIFLYLDKYNFKFKGKLFRYFFKPFIFFMILFYNIFVFNNLEFGINYLFISILYENEYNFCDVVFKLKLYIAFSIYLLFDDFTQKFYFLINNISWLNNSLIGIRTIYIILMLGQEITLDQIILKIIKILIHCNLLYK